MSRRYTDRYEERDYYDRRPPRSHYDELDIEIDRGRVGRRPAPSVSGSIAHDERRRAPRQPDFLREDYGRESAGPLVIRESEKLKEVTRESKHRDHSPPVSRRALSPPAEKVVDKEIIIRETIRDDVSDGGKSRKSVASKAPRMRESIVEDRRGEFREAPRGRPRRDDFEEEVIIKRVEHDSPPPRRKEIIEDKEVFYRRESSRPPPRRESDREDYYYRHESPPRRRDDREIEKEEIMIRRSDSPSPRRLDRKIVEHDWIVVDDRKRDRSRPPARMHSLGPAVAREREEFYFRRRRSPSPASPPPPPPAADYEREQIIIRRRESSPPPRSLTPEIESEPEPEPEPIVEPMPLRERSPEPAPIIRPPIIQHVYTHHHYYEHNPIRAPSPSPSPPPPPRSPTPPPVPSPPPPAPVHKREESLEIEIRRRGVRGGKEFYEKDVIKERERDRDREEEVKETKEDVKITRIRSKSAHQSVRSFRDERETLKPIKKDMWTEVNKDLVIREAIEKAGYDYEDKGTFFNVKEYLKYDDVVRLVDMSDEIRLAKRAEMEWQRELEDRASVTSARPRPRERTRDVVYEHDRIREIREVREVRDRDRDARSVRSGRYR